jgi:hypothetical protein
MPDPYRYGIAEDVWEDIVKKIRRILIQRAEEKRTIYYSDLVKEIKTIPLEPDSPALYEMLEEISRNEVELGRY